MHMACGIHVVLNLSIPTGHLITFLNSYQPMPPDSYGHIRQLRSFLDSYDHIWTVTIISRGQLRSCRRCLVCKLRSYHASFTSPYFKNKCTDWQSMTRKTTTDDAPVLCTNKRTALRTSVTIDPARTHRRRRPPSCMIVTVMIVTVSPQWY